MQLTKAPPPAAQRTPSPVEADAVTRVIENVELALELGGAVPRRQRRERSLASLNEVGVTGYANRLPSQRFAMSDPTVDRTPRRGELARRKCTQSMHDRGRGTVSSSRATFQASCGHGLTARRARWRPMPWRHRTGARERGSDVARPAAGLAGRGG